MTTTPQAALLTKLEVSSVLQKTAESIDSCNIVMTHWDLVARAIEQAILAKLQATQAEPPKDVSMPQYWSVDVFSDGAKIVSIGNDWLSGERPLDEIDERTIIGAAQHLLSFVGHGLPPTSFDPDAQAEPAQAAADARDALLTESARWEKSDHRLAVWEALRVLGSRMGVMVTCEDQYAALATHQQGGK